MKTKLVFYLLILILFTTCHNSKKSKNDILSHLSDYEQIKERGEIVAITDYNSINYFVYRGQPMGFQYDLLQEFADYSGMKLEVIVSNDLEYSFRSLEEGKCDIIARNLTITKERKEVVNFTVPHSQTRQVLVQRLPVNKQRMNSPDSDLGLIRNQLMLADKNVLIYVPQNSSYAARLNNLANEIGDSIRFIEVDEEVEKLISRVAKGEIDYTVCDENIAYVNQSYYDNIDIQTPISFPQHLAWAVNKNSPELLQVINKWFEDFKKTRRYAVMYKKYFENRKTSNMIKSEYYSLRSGMLSDYDDIIKSASNIIGWDWRLLASLIYQESRFNPSARSWAGAFGLMQFMPNTAKRYGINIHSHPSEQILAGAKYIKWLNNRFINEIDNDQERIKFILASYNVGYGHVRDAQRLAKKYGKNPYEWDNNVNEFLLKKSEPKYYSDPVVMYGYCRGEQPYYYVGDILERYNHYKNIIRIN